VNFSKVKIGVVTFGFNQWGGGIDFIVHILSFLQEIEKGERNIETTIFLPKNSFINTLKNFLYPWRNLIIQCAKGKKLNWQKRSIIPEDFLHKEILNFDHSFEIVFCGNSLDAQIRAAKKRGLDLILPCIDVPRKSKKLPWIGYLADLQHLHMPEYFTKKEIKYRNESFRHMLDSSKNIIVYSKKVIKDIEEHFPGHSATIHPLPFCPCPQKQWLENDNDVREKYGINEPYFLICNQFWVHKNHKTAFYAFAKFLNDGGSAILVCTGKFSDPRYPNYPNELLALLNKLGISKEVRILDYISKQDQVSLIKKSLGVVQPTLYEGGPGGGSSYDAIALGVPLIVSDIPINQEINSGDVTYFKSENSDELAEALHAISNRKVARLSGDQLWRLGLERKKIISNVLLNVINSALMQK
jgi:glycosyltransferase involved in cell wall biosynthesis